MVYYRNNKSDPLLILQEDWQAKTESAQTSLLAILGGQGLSSDCGGWGDLASFCILLIISSLQGDGLLATFYAASLALILVQRNDAACP